MFCKDTQVGKRQAGKKLGGRWKCAKNLGKFLYGPFAENGLEKVLEYDGRPSLLLFNYFNVFESYFKHAM